MSTTEMTRIFFSLTPRDTLARHLPPVAGMIHAWCQNYWNCRIECRMQYRVRLPHLLHHHNLALSLSTTVVGSKVSICNNHHSLGERLTRDIKCADFASGQATPVTGLHLASKQETFASWLLAVTMLKLLSLITLQRKILPAIIYYMVVSMLYSIPFHFIPFHLISI